MPSKKVLGGTDHIVSPWSLSPLGITGSGPNNTAVLLTLSVGGHQSLLCFSAQCPVAWDRGPGT